MATAGRTSRSRQSSRSSSRSSPKSRAPEKGKSSRAASSSRTGEARSTRDHDEIRRWAEERGGSPACVRGTGGRGDTGMLRIDFPGYSGEQSLQHITWEEFFEKFDEKGLEFLHQDKTRGGKTSRLFKLVSGGGSSGGGRRASRRNPRG